MDIAPTDDKKILTDKDIVCLGHLKRVFPMLERLRRDVLPGGGAASTIPKADGLGTWKNDSEAAEHGLRP